MLGEDEEGDVTSSLWGPQDALPWVPKSVSYCWHSLSKGCRRKVPALPAWRLFYICAHRASTGPAQHEPSRHLCQRKGEHQVKNGRNKWGSPSCETLYFINCTKTKKYGIFIPNFLPQATAFGYLDEALVLPAFVGDEGISQSMLRYMADHLSLSRWKHRATLPFPPRIPRPALLSFSAGFVHRTPERDFFFVYIA